MGAGVVVLFMGIKRVRGPRSCFVVGEEGPSFSGHAVVSSLFVGVKREQPWGRARGVEQGACLWAHIHCVLQLWLLLGVGINPPRTRVPLLPLPIPHPIPSQLFLPRHPQHHKRHHRKHHDSADGAPYDEGDVGRTACGWGGGDVEGIGGDGFAWDEGGG
jgi:hypothetical protein